jgi:hypothetical protein
MGSELETTSLFMTSRTVPRAGPGDLSGTRNVDLVRDPGFERQFTVPCIVSDIEFEFAQSIRRRFRPHCRNLKFFG